MCILLREKYSINTVALSGGVFQNNFLITNCYNKLIEQNFNVLTHNQIPTNDGGISIGQLAIANVKALQWIWKLQIICYNLSHNQKIRMVLNE